MTDKETPETPETPKVETPKVETPKSGNFDTTDPIVTKLKELGIVDDTQIAEIKKLGVESVSDLSSLKESDLTSIGIPVIKARKLVLALKEAPDLSSYGINAPITANSMNIDAMLPSVPDDASWLNSLRAGGVLKVEQATVIAAIRVALADCFGLYDIPKKLVSSMEDFIEVTEEQVGDEFWKIRKQLTRKSYGDLFQAIEGLDGSFVTEKRKDELLKRINECLWPAILSFNEALASWQEAWMQGTANPAMMMAAVASLAGGGGGAGMPPGMMQSPDCGVLRDAAESVNDALNKTFRGTGVQITSALAFEANQIKSMIDNPRLPSLCGIPTRELLLKKLNVAVPATYPRMETNLTKFVLGIMQTENVAAGNEELQYFGTLFMLGAQIPWEDLKRIAMFPGGTTRPAGIGNRRKALSD